MQILDERHLLIQYGSGPLLLKCRNEESPGKRMGPALWTIILLSSKRPDLRVDSLPTPCSHPAKRSLDNAGTLAFFVFYNFVEGRIVDVYDNSDDDLLQEVGDFPAHALLAQFCPQVSVSLHSRTEWYC